jgi:hypothetical protein
MGFRSKRISKARGAWGKSRMLKFVVLSTGMKAVCRSRPKVGNSAPVDEKGPTQCVEHRGEKSFHRPDLPHLFCSRTWRYCSASRCPPSIPFLTLSPEFVTFLQYEFGANHDVIRSSKVPPCAVHGTAGFCVVGIIACKTNSQNHSVSPWRAYEM